MLNMKIALVFVVLVALASCKDDENLDDCAAKNYGTWIINNKSDCDMSITVNDTSVSTLDNPVVLKLQSNRPHEIRIYKECTGKTDTFKINLGFVVQCGTTNYTIDK